MKGSVEKGHKKFLVKMNFVENTPILYSGLFRCVKQCPVFFSAGFCFFFQDITYAKNSVFPGGVFRSLFVVTSVCDLKDTFISKETAKC